MHYHGVATSRVNAGPKQVGTEHQIHRALGWRVLARGKDCQKLKQQEAQSSHE
jgi:hypothetical protein